jgi:2-polyprenyl-6-methoxyphenol hydroxylase-like FAD-dependent oxidoreductase
MGIRVRSSRDTQDTRYAIRYLKQKDFVLDADVLIVGAGPVGTGLAAELGRRGVRCIVIEMTDGVFRDPRLHAVSIRTMELVRKWGLTEELRNCGWPADHPQDIAFVTSLSGYELGRIPWLPISKMSPPAESPTFAQRCPQSWFNPILHRYAQRFPSVAFRWRTRFQSFHQDEDGVDVHVVDENTGKEATLRGRYLVGCDGGRSAIRELLGIERDSTGTYGYSAEAIIESAALADLARPRIAGRYTAVTAEGVSASLLPYDGRDQFRMTLMAEPSKVDRARMDEAILQLAGKDIPYAYRTGVLPWVNRETCAQRFRDGRVFIGGDAARTMPPTGGHGMNTGILDGFDLGWKLAAVLQGWGGERLLDSYEFDRKKGGARTAAMAGEIYKDWIKVRPTIEKHGPMLEEATERGAAARQFLGELLTGTFRREFNSVGASIGYRYSGSPVLVDDGSPEPPDEIVKLHQSARPGHRIPHAWIGEGQSTLDLVGDVYTLIEVGQGSYSTEFKAAAAECGMPLEVRRIDDPSIARLFESTAILVRPDQHVAWRAHGERADAKHVLNIVSGRARCDVEATA